MSVSLRLTSAFVSFVILLAGAGCITESSNKSGNTPATTANTNATGAAAKPGPPPAMTTPPNTQPVTLPVLDAFFALENFEAELKSKLQLTDEQVNKLRNIARQETSKLRESDNHDKMNRSPSFKRTRPRPGL